MKKSQKVIVQKGDKKYECTLVTYRKAPTTAEKVYTALYLTEAALLAACAVGKIVSGRDSSSKTRFKKRNVGGEIEMQVLEKAKPLTKAPQIQRIKFEK